jgi:arginyl-tRNA synthetase
MQKLGLDDDGGFSARELGKAYALGATTYKTDESVQAEIRAINKKIYDRSDEEINKLYDAGRKVSLDYFEHIYKVVDTEFAAYFFESEAGPKGKELVLANPEIFPESDGARVFTGEDYGLHTRVFLNKEGLPTYEAKEVALAKMKENKFGAYDLSVISTANEVSEYFKVLKKAMSFVYPDLAAKTEHIGHGMVRLSTGKMSSRTGDVISAIDFIDEVAVAALAKMASGGETQPEPALARDVAVAAIKYTTLRGNILQNSIFDKERALSFEGDSGPYLQYTHARICSVLGKAAVTGLKSSVELPPQNTYELEHLVYQFPEVVASALAERAPHKITTYLTELAGSFNSFYAKEKIADPQDTYAPYKIALTESVKTTLKNGLWILAIKAPEKM